MLIEKLGAIVIGDLFARLDIFYSKDIYTSILKIALAIWCAGVVNVSGDVVLYISVDHRGVACPEQVLATISIAFPFSNPASDVFNDAGALCDRFLGD